MKNILFLIFLLLSCAEAIAQPGPSHTTATKAYAARLSNGTSFITPTTPSDTQPVSGTVTANPTAAGYWTPKLVNALSTTVVEVKATTAALGGYYCYNPNAAVAYVQFFNVASATSVTLGVTVPLKSIGIPATGGGNLEWAQGVNFSNGLKVAATTTATGLTANATALDCNFDYK